MTELYRAVARLTEDLRADSENLERWLARLHPEVFDVRTVRTLKDRFREFMTYERQLLEVVSNVLALADRSGENRPMTTATIDRPGLNAHEAYRALVFRIADGEEVDAEQIRNVLFDVEKSKADLRGAVDRLVRRRQNAQDVRCTHFGHYARRYLHETADPAIEAEIREVHQRLILLNAESKTLHSELEGRPLDAFGSGGEFRNKNEAYWRNELSKAQYKPGMSDSERTAAGHAIRACQWEVQRFVEKRQRLEEIGHEELALRTRLDQLEASKLDPSLVAL